MQISYQLTAKDYMVFQRRFFLKFLYLLPLVSMTIVAGLFVAKHLGAGVGEATGLLLGGLWVYFLFFYVPKNAKEIAGEQEATFTEQGFTMKGKFGENQLSWGTVHKFVERRRYFYLYVNQLTAHIIPKRAFSSAQQMEEFRQLVKRSVGQPHPPQTIQQQINEVQSSETQLTVSYQLTKEEYLRLRRRALMKNPVMFTLLLGLPVVMFSIFAINTDIWYGAIMTIFFEAMVLYGIFFQTPKKIHETELTFTEHGMAAKTALAEHKTSWGTIFKFTEQDDHFLLYINKRATYAIPKRAFASEQQMDEFRQLLDRSIQKVV